MLSIHYSISMPIYCFFWWMLRNWHFVAFLAVSNHSRSRSSGDLITWHKFLGDRPRDLPAFPTKNPIFYTPVFRRDVLWVWWCPSVHPSVRPGLRPSVHPSVRPSVTVFRTFLLHALRYWAEILFITLLWCT